MNHLTTYDSKHSFSPDFNSLGMKACELCGGNQELDEQVCPECLGGGEVEMIENDRLDRMESHLEDYKD